MTVDVNIRLQVISGGDDSGEGEEAGEFEGAVAFVSDLQGDWAQWERYVAFSNLLSWESPEDGTDSTESAAVDSGPTEGGRVLTLAPGAELVFGGNVLGESGGGLRLTRLPPHSPPRPPPPPFFPSLMHCEP